MKRKSTISTAAYLVSLEILVGLLGAVCPAIAQDTAGTVNSTKRLENGTDPIDFISRLEVKNEYVDIDGGHENVTTFQGDYAFSKTFLVRMEVPVVDSDPPGSAGGPELLDLPVESGVPGASPKTGLGDILVRAVARVLKTDSFAMGVGAEVILDSATADETGTGKNQFAPILAAVYYPVEELSIFPIIKDHISFGGDSDRADIHFLSFELNVEYDWPRGWWTTLAPELLINFEDDNKKTLIIDVEAGKMFNENVGAWVRPGTHVAGEKGMNWNIQVGVRYLFN